MCRMKLTIPRLLIGATLLAAPAWTWSRGGHMTVAYIAYQKLTPAVKLKADELLKQNPSYLKWVEDIPDTPENKEQRSLRAFLRAALWADDIKFDGAYDDADAKPGSNGNVPSGSPENAQNIGYTDQHRHKYWHFHDMAFTTDGTTLGQPATPSALTQIPILRDGLKNGSGDIPSYDLVWLIHLVGDVHQPLHAAERFTATHTDGDDGGNKQLLCKQTCSQKLHSFWDGLLGTDLDYDAAMARGSDLIEENPGGPSGTGIEDVSVWITRSFQLAKQRSYALPIRKDGKPSSTNKTYRKKAHDTAESQVLVAGHRLARLINNALS